MKPSNFIARVALMGMAALAACVPSSDTQPISTPTPTAVQSPAAAALPPPPVQEVRYDNYLDAPQTPGDWRYVDRANDTAAIYGLGSQAPAFAIACNRHSGLVHLSRPAPRTSRLVFQVRTETVTRNLGVSTPSDYADTVEVLLQPSDSVLDAMAITKGRIAIETEGMPTLYLPAWPEISRVIEDCR